MKHIQIPKLPFMSATIAMALEYICASFTVAQFRTCLANSPAIFVSISKCICPNFKMYFSQFQNEFVPISKCICHNFKMYMSQFQNIVVPISKCICPNFKMYLSQFQNMVVPLSKCICPNFKIAFTVVQFRTCLANGLVPILPE